MYVIGHICYQDRTNFVFVFLGLEITQLMCRAGRGASKLANWPLPYYTLCINSLLKNISDKLAQLERTNAILVEYIQSEQYLNVSQKNTRINGTVWFSTCVVKKWPFGSRCEQKSTLLAIPTVVWCSKLIHNALGGRCPDLALSPKFFPMPVC